MIAYDGRVSSAAVLAPFWPCCPDGWRPCISHVPVDQEVLAAYEGQVLQVLPRPCTALDARLASPAASGEVSGPPVPTPAGSRNIRREPSALETAPDFGPTVPTGSTGHDPGETSSTLTETAGPVETPPFFEGLFAVIGQDYCPELVHVRLPTGTHVAEALRCINAAREPGPRLCLPRLLAVHPADGGRDWTTGRRTHLGPPRALILFDCTRVNGALFALQMPHVVHRQL